MNSATEDGMTTFTNRLMGAATLDDVTYEDIEHDPRATMQALTVVILASVAAGIGSAGIGHASLENTLVVTMSALIAWAAWAVITYEIGVHLLPEPQTDVSVEELLRTLGFSTAPALLCLVAVFPEMSVPAFTLTAGWLVTTMIVAVRHALDYKSTGRAMLVCAIGAALTLGIVYLFGLVFGTVLA